MAKPRTLTLDRFFANVNFLGPIAKNHPELGRCHVWKRRLSGWGYGEFALSWRPAPRIRTYAHVFAWEVANKRYKPDDLDLDHFACDNRACCNPEHVRLETHGKNALRADSPPSRNAKKAKCPEGHPYDQANTMYRKNGHRRCRTCVYAQNLESQRRRRARASQRR